MKKMGNNGMPTSKQKLIHNPIPDQLECTDPARNGLSAGSNCMKRLA